MKKLGIRIKDIEKHKPMIAKLSPETLKSLRPKKNEKSVNDYILNYLGRALFDTVQQEWDKCFKKSFPKKLKEECLWCTKKSQKEEDKNCSTYRVECQINYFLAAQEFVSFVENNKQLIKGQQLKKELTMRFFECFSFFEGRVIFDLQKMILRCLHAGFLTLSQILAKNTPLQSLSLINNSIDKLNSEKLEYEMFSDDEPFHIDPQLKYFKNKQSYFKEKHFLQKEGLTNDINTKKSKIDNLKDRMLNYGFDNLDSIGNKKINTLIEHIGENKCPYQLAYLDYIGFNKFLLKKYCNSERELQKILAKILDTNERTIRGNLNALKNPRSNDRGRYSAHHHLESVKNHFKNLK